MYHSNYICSIALVTLTDVIVLLNLDGSVVPVNDLVIDEGLRVSDVVQPVNDHGQVLRKPASLSEDQPL